MNFEELYQSISGISVLDDHYLYPRWETALSCVDVPGEVAEVGAFRGGSAKFFCQVFQQKNVFIYDTFVGMPATWDLAKGESWFKNDDGGKAYFEPNLLETAKTTLKDCPNAIICPGFFPDSIPTKAKECRYAYIHFDGDLYQTLIDSLEFFWPRMEPGAILFVDDFCREQTPGVALALRKFFIGCDLQEYTCEVKWNILAAIIKKT